MKLRITILLAFATLIAAATSIAASGPTVIAQGKRTAHGAKTNTYELYLRAYGHHLRASAATHCVGGPRQWDNHHTTTLSRMRSGQLYRVSFGGNPYAWGKLSAGDCDITATLRGTGRLRLQILAR